MRAAYNVSENENSTAQDCATLFTQEWTLVNIIAAARGDFLRPLLDPAAACSSEVPRGLRGRIFAIAAL